MKLRLIILLLWFSQTSFANIYLPAKINSEKSTFFIGEPIYIKLVINNHLDSIAAYSTYNFPQYYEIKDQNNNILNLNWKSSAGSRTYIFPGDSIVYIDNISILFGKVKVESIEEHYGLKSGKYTIQFKIQKRDIVIESNILIINVVSPPLEEDEAFNLYNKAWINRFSKAPKRNRQEIKEQFLEVISKYPKSVYAPAALNSIRSIDYQNRNIYNENLVSEYPRDYSTGLAIDMLIDEYYSQKDKIGVELLLNRIIQSSKGTFVAQYANMKLNKINSITVEEWLNPELITRRKLREYQKEQQKR